MLRIFYFVLRIWLLLLLYRIFTSKEIYNQAMRNEFLLYSQVYFEFSLHYDSVYKSYDVVEREKSIRKLEIFWMIKTKVSSVTQSKNISMSLSRKTITNCIYTTIYMYEKKNNETRVSCVHVDLRKRCPWF